MSLPSIICSRMSLIVDEVRTASRLLSSRSRLLVCKVEWRDVQNLVLRPSLLRVSDHRTIFKSRPRNLVLFPSNRNCEATSSDFIDV